MRYSAWSSQSTWACSALAAVAALTVVGAAEAHVSIEPRVVPPRSVAEVVLSVPNEANATGVDHVTLGIPGAFALDDAETKPGWTQSRTGQAITWSGGVIRKGQFARFAIRGTAPARPVRILFNVLVGNRKGKSTTYRVALDVGAAPTARPRTSGVAKAALILAVAAAVLAAGALLAAASRGPRP